MKAASRMGNVDRKQWVDGLGEDDLAFLKRFVLSSGSLKELARLYGISYPTVRLRLDRLIEKVKVLDSDAFSSDVERLLRTLYADGKIDAATLNAIIAAYRRETDGKQ